MKKKFLVISIIALLTLSACTHNNDTAKPNVDTAPPQDEIVSKNFDDYMVVPEFLVCDQIVIATDETILWVGVDYDLATYAYNILRDTPGGTVALYVNDNVDETGTYQFTLTFDDVAGILSILEDNPGSGLRLGKNLPSNCSIKEQEMVEPDKIHILSYFDEANLTGLIDLLESGHEEYIHIEQQLCPDGNHDIGRHVGGALFTYIDLKAALEGLTESGFPTMVWDTVLTGPEDNFL